MKLIFAIIEKDRLGSLERGTLFTCCYCSWLDSKPHFYICEKGINRDLAIRLYNDVVDGFYSSEPVITFKKPTFLQRIKEKIWR